jgi:hypothetical protein
LMLAAVLVQFYRRASAVFISPATYAGELWRSLAYNRRILLDYILTFRRGPYATSTLCNAVF